MLLERHGDVRSGLRSLQGVHEPCTTASRGTGPMWWCTAPQVRATFASGQRQPTNVDADDETR
jgi:hypothetical protein